jgi:hypothetical protein
MIIGFGLVKLFEHVNQKDINLSDTVDILNEALKKLDINSETYEEKLEVITNMILELKREKTIDDEKNLKNKIFTIQALFDLNALLTHT